MANPAGFMQKAKDCAVLKTVKVVKENLR